MAINFKLQRAVTEKTQKNMTNISAATCHTCLHKETLPPHLLSQQSRHWRCAKRIFSVFDTTILLMWGTGQHSRSISALHKSTIKKIYDIALYFNSTQTNNCFHSSLLDLNSATTKFALHHKGMR